MLEELSDIDKKILELIQKDNSLTNSELAEKVGLSTAPCWRRIKRLEEMGYISKQVSLLNPDKLGLKIIVFSSVKLNHHGDNALENFEEIIKTYPEIVECYTTSGTMDYLLKIITTDMAAYEVFQRRKILSIDSVVEVHTRFTVTEVKNTTEMPLTMSV